MILDMNRSVEKKYLNWLDGRNIPMYRALFLYPFVQEVGYV